MARRFNAGMVRPRTIPSPGQEILNRAPSPPPEVTGYFRECLRYLLQVALVLRPHNLTQRG